MKAPDGPGGKPVDVIGATLPGLPSVVLGRTAGVAWGFTNTGPDVQDLYLEQINRDNPRQYRTPQGWADFEQREEVIKVKGQPDEKLVVRTTRHGPVLSDANAGYAEVIDTRRYALALRWAALDPDNQTVLAGLLGNSAQTVDELLAADALYHSPMQSMVAADTQGHTVYQAIGRVPLRQPGNDLRGMAPAPGWDAKYDWAGWLPAAQNPHVDQAAIEAKGWHATANQRIHAKDYPYFIGQDWVTPERFDRIEELLAATPKHTRAVDARRAGRHAVHRDEAAAAGAAGDGERPCAGAGRAGDAQGLRRQHARGQRRAAGVRVLGRRAHARPDRAQDRRRAVQGAVRQAHLPRRRWRPCCWMRRPARSGARR